MKEITVLMGWHQESDPVKKAAFEANRSSFIEYNPSVDIVTVMNVFDDVSKAWMSTDLSMFHWYVQNYQKYPSKRYLIVEWDCWCDCDLNEYFGRVWDLDLVVPCVKYPERDDWYWFTTVAELPKEVRQFITGITPLCGIMLSAKAMKSISEEILKPEYASLMSELRLGTIATMLNFDPIVNPVCNRLLGWRFPSPFDKKYKGLHHPRKKIEE